MLSGVLPNDWLTANSYYYLTSVFCRMLESIIKGKIMTYFDTNNLFSEQQHGFRPKIRLEPIMLKNLPIIPSRTSQKFYPLFLIYFQILTYYSFIILLILLGQ